MFLLVCIDYLPFCRRGALIFIDEADSFLEDREYLTPSRVRVLNEFIFHTGTESRNVSLIIIDLSLKQIFNFIYNQFMAVFETNRPWVIDPAVMSRISRTVEFPNPSPEDIQSMLTRKINAVLKQNSNNWFSFSFRKTPPIDFSVLDNNTIKTLAKTFAAESFVGRDITNFVILLAQAAFANDMKITKEVLEEVLPFFFL